MSRFRYGAVSEGAERHIGFHLSNHFDMLPFIAAVESFRIANRRAGKALYQWSVVTSDGKPVVASNGMTQASDYAISSAPDFSLLFVCGPYDPGEFDDPEALEWLARLGKTPLEIGGIETGCHVLAQAGLLDGRECTTHWENLDEFRESFPQHSVSADVFEVDGNRITCSGGSASMDMVLYLIERDHGHELAASVADSMIHPQIRNASEPQRMDLQSRTGVNHPALLECIELMEANIEQPLTPNELAKLVGVSKRQLERLFQRHLHTTPARYYLIVRLETARQLLEHSSMKIIDVAVACGFKSAGHFSSRFFSSFGITPREIRKPQVSRH